jgi:hypothetical protein
MTYYNTKYIKPFVTVKADLDADPHRSALVWLGELRDDDSVSMSYGNHSEAMRLEIFLIMDARLKISCDPLVYCSHGWVKNYLTRRILTK